MFSFRVQITSGVSMNASFPPRSHSFNKLGVSGSKGCGGRIFKHAMFNFHALSGECNPIEPIEYTLSMIQSY